MADRLHRSPTEVLDRLMGDDMIDATFYVAAREEEEREQQHIDSQYEKMLAFHKAHSPEE